MTKRQEDLGGQVSDLLSSIGQHISNKEYGTEGVIHGMVGAVLDLFLCHRGGKIPSDTGKVGFIIGNKSFWLWVTTFLVLVEPTW